MFCIYAGTESLNSTAFHYPVHPLSPFLHSILISVDEEKYVFVVVDKQIMAVYE
jgi:hypothetical protein